jgi:hypothetical protein
MRTSDPIQDERWMYYREEGRTIHKRSNRFYGTRRSLKTKSHSDGKEMYMSVEALEGDDYEGKNFLRYDTVKFDRNLQMLWKNILLRS